jgi:phosphoribosylformimino-5-aminoimidazole carboxamide ribotide isomerase
LIGTLDPSLAERFVGVIDLAGGRAVHAIAGDRDAYRDVAFCDGNPIALAAHYHDLGLRNLYIADLDSIRGGAVQQQVIERLLEAGDSFTFSIDPGWCSPQTGSEGPSTGMFRAIERLSNRYPALRWIAATESCRSLSDLQLLADRAAPGQWLLGLDYRDGQLLRHEADEHEWISAARQSGCRGAVVLDLAAVGTGIGPQTADPCRRVRRLAPTWTLYSGGGVRNPADAQELIDAGCDRILVATALHPPAPTER